MFVVAHPDARSRTRTDSSDSNVDQPQIEGSRATKYECPLYWSDFIVGAGYLGDIHGVNLGKSVCTVKASQNRNRT